ncbi:DoxX family protein [Patescibacteria group bacterium]
MLALFPNLFALEQLAPLIIRVVLALIFLTSGYSKVFKTLTKTSKIFESMKMRPGKLWVVVIGVMELVSGILLTIGFLTQLVAIVIALIMVGAIVMVKLRQGFISGYAFELLILACALALLLMGPGIFSIDLPL